MANDEHLQTDYVALTQLTPHPRNVRQGDVGAISVSLAEHGQYRPIVVQRSTGHIVAGNHTYHAAAALGWKQLAVTYVDVTDEQALRIMLVDNRTNDLASYDDTALSNLLAALAATDQTLTGTGYDEDDLDALIETLNPPALDQTTYSLIVTCTNEHDQKQLVNELLQRNFIVQLKG